MNEHRQFVDAGSFIRLTRKPSTAGKWWHRSVTTAAG